MSRFLSKQQIISTTAICCAALLCSTGFTPTPNTLTFRFQNKVGPEDLQLMDHTYTDPFGEPMTIYKFKYYISHIAVITEDGKEQLLDDGCHLVDEADSLSKTITVPSPSQPIKAITFLLGVDSLKNVSGAQAGDLDPLKGMYWTWNTGYVDAELEGRSDSSHANAHFISWHVGGFKPHQDAARHIKLEWTKSEGRTILIDADIKKWFNARHPIRIAQSPVCHEPGPLAMAIADNYSLMFSIEQ